jgi:Fe/S biogenesis protein NfuA
VIGLHAERVTGDDRVVRWVMPAGILPAGRVRRAPGQLGELLSEGTLSGALVEYTAVWLWLREGLAWSAKGNCVQGALRQALADPAGWEIEPAPGEVLEAVTADLLTGSVGDFVRSHGGSVESHRDGEDVEVRLGGACEHCPAAEHTLRLRLLEAMRRRCPEIVESDRGAGTLRLSLRSL